MLPKRRKLNEEEEGNSSIGSQKQSIDSLLCQRIGFVKSPDKSLRFQAIAFTSAHLKHASLHILKHHITGLLEQQLWDEEDPLLVQHIIKVLGDVANNLADETTLRIVDMLHKYLESHRCYDDLITTQIVGSLICIAQQSGSFRELDGAVAVSLLSTAKISLRTLLLNLLAVTTKSSNTQSATEKITRVRDIEGCNLVFQIFEAFTKDPYPSVRKAALEGLISLHKKGLISLHKKGYILPKDSYKHPAALLQDKDELVRLCAIQMVSRWVEMLHQNTETHDANQIDETFLQVCAMSRDMNMKVRTEAHYALGRMGPISESILLQALSKKLLGLQARKKVSNAFATETPENDIDSTNCGEGLQLLTLSAAGAFVHGVEDEFSEVRTAAIDSLARLSAFSKEFADGALDLLMDMLNDDSEKVRMQTLYALCQMADIDRLTVQEKHMHMFLGMLEDINADIRSAARRLLGRMKLPSISVFKMSIKALMNNLEKYPQDEQDIIYVMYCTGKNHGTFVVCSANEFVQQIMTYSDKDSGLDQPQIPALLILLLGAQVSNVGILFHIPQKFISYANHFCGKFSSAILGSTANAKIQNFLSEDSQKCSENSNLDGLLATEETELSVQEVADDMHHRTQQSFDSNSIESATEFMVLNSEDIFSKSSLKNCETSAHGTNMSKQRQRKGVCAHEKEIVHLATNILKAVAGTWPLIKEKSLSEVLKTLSGCRADLEKIRKVCQVFSSTIAFATLYTRCICLLAKLWATLTPGSCHHTYQCGIASAQPALEQMDKILRRMRYCFLGLCEEQQLCILELNALSYILRLSLLREYGSCLTHNRLNSIISLADSFNKGDGVRHSTFLGRIKQLVDEDSKLVCYSGLVRELPDLFSLEPIPIGPELKEIRAVLHVPNNNSEHPLGFVRGLPLGITMHITLHNIPSTCRMWLLMVLGDEVQYTFLDVNEFEGIGGVKCGTITRPFYPTLKAASCSLEISVLMECPFDHSTVPVQRFQTGPIGELVSLSTVERVHLAVSCGNY